MDRCQAILGLHSFTGYNTVSAFTGKGRITALTLLYMWKGVAYHVISPLSDGVLAWLSLWSVVQMICIWSSWCHCHPTISCFSKMQNGLPFWCWLTQVVLEKRPLNVCVCIVPELLPFAFPLPINWVPDFWRAHQLSNVIFYPLAVDPSLASRFFCN